MSAPFDMLPPELHPARPYLARALHFGRSLLASGERPGSRAWVYGDDSDSAVTVDAVRLGQHLDDHAAASVLVALRFERQAGQLRAVVHVQVHGEAIELVGEAHADRRLLGPWTVQP